MGTQLRYLFSAVNRRLDDYGLLVNQRSFVEGVRLYRKWRKGFTCSIPEMEFLRQIVRNGDTVFDVGANVGEFSFFLSTIVAEGLIHCFEPQRKPFSVLQGVCYNLENTHPHKMGFSSSSGETTLFIPIVNGHVSPAEASLDPHLNSFAGPERRPKASESIAETVQMTTLDGFIERGALHRLDFVKVDVEGHELEVLKGGSRICLQELRPLFLIEIFPYVYDGHFETVCKYLENHRYIGFVLTPDGSSLQPLTPQNAYDNPGYNFFFVPHERTTQLTHCLRHV